MREFDSGVVVVACVLFLLGRMAAGAQEIGTGSSSVSGGLHSAAIGETKGMIQIIAPEMEKVISSSAWMEKCSEGYQWSEGPVWKEGTLYFSDVPGNKIHQWFPEEKQTKVFLEPSGGIASSPEFNEAGSNGLTLDAQGRLLLCQCGARRVARLETDGRQMVLADRFQGKKFNSPNDLVQHSSGAIYFTDPPYGLKGGDESPLKEMPWHGVYRIDPSGDVALLTKDLVLPNGLAFSPDEKILYVGISDDKKPCLWAFEMLADGTLGKGRIFFDAAVLKGPGINGTCDGLKIDQQGNLWTTAPGGVAVIDPAGKLLGLIRSKDQVSNCAWGGDGSVLYLTIGSAVWRVQTKTRGVVVGKAKG